MIKRLLLILAMLLTLKSFAQVIEVPSLGAQVVEVPTIGPSKVIEVQESPMPTETTNAEVNYAKPIVLTIQNDSPVDVASFLVVQENISPEDITRLLDATLYAHTQRTFTLNRTGYPAHIDIIFRIAYTERGYHGYTIARWEYTETDAQVNVCHREEATKPYFVGCSGDDVITAPIVNFTIGYQEAPRNVPHYPLPSP